MIRDTQHLRNAKKFDPMIDGLTGKTLRALRDRYAFVGRRRVRGWHAWLAIGLTSGLFIGVVAVATWSQPQEVSTTRTTPPVEFGETSAATKPNIVFILTDDQRSDTLWAMPKVQQYLTQKGVNFTNGFVVNSVCCPSRASILTGNYSHTTKIYRNKSPYGGFEEFKDASTIATMLKSAGYRTSLIGKYLNGYRTDGLYIPPGWDNWVAITEGGYFDYQLNKNGTLVNYGSAPEDYSTDVLRNEAVSFIRSAPSPFFLYFAPNAPHSPATPAPRHATAFSSLSPWRPPSYNEDDVSDKPAWVRNRPKLDATERAELDAFRLNQYRTLLAVDEAVEAIVQALSANGQLSNTLIVFLSDNGHSWGEHRWTKKTSAYEEDIRVPFIVRYDPLTGGIGRTETRFALNIDLYETAAQLAGVSASTDGRSLVPLLSASTASSAAWRDRFLVEHLNIQEGQNSPPTYCAVRHKRFTYVKYGTGEEELYDNPADRYQLKNVASDPAYATSLSNMRQAKENLCQPKPPGFTQ